jgi:hypothetical protein
MAINFPNSPANGDTHVSGEKTFNYDAAKGVWNLEGNLKAALDITSTPPSSPSHGDLWMDETTGDMYTYFTDADSSQWIQVNGVGAVGAGGGSGGATVYADMAALIAATGMSNGDLALVSATNNMYAYNGTGWWKIATLQNDSPTTITGVNGSYSLESDGTPTVITAVSTDPEGFPLTWSYAVTSGSLGTTATVSQADNVFTITPGTNDPADVGTFELTFSVTDGSSGATSVASSFSLEFLPINGQVIGASGLTSSSYGSYLIKKITSGNGSFTIPTTAKYDLLMVGGGGGGGDGNAAGGGGGAGGMVEGFEVTLPAGDYTISVGAGGYGASVNDGSGSTGGNTVLTNTSTGQSITALGGGAGRGWSGTLATSNGGSGGGDTGPDNSSGTSIAQAKGSFTAFGSESFHEYGNDGGNKYGNEYGGGGGGAGSAAGSQGASGDPRANSIETGSPQYYAEGATGATFQGTSHVTTSYGLGGNGGKYGNSSTEIAPTSGTNGTGSGGGGKTDSFLTTNVGQGGSGIFVLRHV